VDNNLPITVKNYAYRDEFIVQGNVGALQAEYGVGAEKIEKYIRSQEKKA
jgi:deoxyxylulose-5-phosphate synthase